MSDIDMLLEKFLGFGGNKDKKIDKKISKKDLKTINQIFDDISEWMDKVADTPGYHGKQFSDKDVVDGKYIENPTVTSNGFSIRPIDENSYEVIIPVKVRSGIHDDLVKYFNKKYKSAKKTSKMSSFTSTIELKV